MCLFLIIIALSWDGNDTILCLFQVQSRLSVPKVTFLFIRNVEIDLQKIY